MSEFAALNMVDSRIGCAVAGRYGPHHRPADCTRYCIPTILRHVLFSLSSPSPFALSLSPASPSLRFHLSSGIGNSESRPCCSLRRFRSCFLPDISPPFFFFSFRSTEIIKVRNEKEASKGRENARDVSREIWNRNGIGTEINAINLQ